MVRRVLFHVPNFICQPVTHQITWVENGALVNETLGHTPHGGQPQWHPSLAHTHENPRRDHPAGRDLPTSGHRVRRASTRSHDDAYCSAKVEYRRSSTPAYTDRLDLQYSTNNAPTKT